MRFLFFFVHPSKFHVFKNTINKLLSNGHHVEILITTKDVLEDLVITEGWYYKNIFPEGRKISGMPAYISSFINIFRTLYRLYKYLKYKNFDLYITDDLLVYIGKLKKTPCIVFTDDDLSITKQFAIILWPATHILAPDVTYLGKFEKKKIGFPSYKELAYLHPNVFTPNSLEVIQFNPELTPYTLLRLVSLNAYHDVGIKGLSNEQVSQLIILLERYGNVYISSERNLTSHFEKYRIKIKPDKIAHALYFAKLFIGDSQTMTSEAAVLGTPALRCNDFVGKISVMEEKEAKFGLSFNYPPSKFNDMIRKIKELLDADDFGYFRVNRNKMLLEKIDLSAFMIWLFENYYSIDFSKPMEFDNFK